METDARVVNTRKSARYALLLRSLALYIPLIVVSMATTALPAQASGTVQTTFSWTDAWGFTSGDPMAFCSGYLNDAAAVNGAVYTLKSYPVDPNTHILSCYADIAPPTNLLNAYAGSFPPNLGCPVNSLNTSYYGMTCTCNTNFHPDTPAASCVPDCPALASGTCGQNACPANMARQSPTGACACKPGFVPAPNGAAGCVPETYILVLQGGASSIEPWNAVKQRDPQHKKPNVLFTAIVLNSTGIPQPNIPVTITSDVTTDLTVYNDGHEHSDNRPKGKLAVTTANIANAPSTLTVKTDATGIATFFFGAEQAAGEHTLTAKCDKCKNSPQQKVHVEFAGLKKLGDDQTDFKFFITGSKLFTFRGGVKSNPNNPHSDNHYFTDAAAIKIIMLALLYNTEFQKDIPLAEREPLKINDSSLKKGGLYDYKNEWSDPHQMHREGIVVDINNYQAEDKTFNALAESIGISPSWEPKNSKNKTKKKVQPHYHLRLLGAGHDE